MRAALLALVSAAALCACGLAAAYGAGGDTAATAGSRADGSTTAGGAPASPACSSILLVAWSPDGTQIAFVSWRLHHGPLPLRAICVAGADGKNAAPLPHAVCARTCRLGLISNPTQLYWPTSKLLLYGDNFRIYLVPVGGKPRLLGREPGSFEQFSVDAAGDRVAAGRSGDCLDCAGPVTVLDVPSGKIVGRLGGSRLDNIQPSISPDGSQVVFARAYADDSGRLLGLWLADADGSNLHRLVKPNGGATDPLWSPSGGEISYLTPVGGEAALHLVPAGGGKSRTLVRRGVAGVVGWSPDGTRIAFETRGRLEVVNVASGKVRALLKFHIAPSVAWSPDSSQLLVNTWPRDWRRCRTVLWRVPVGGGKPQLLLHC